MATRSLILCVALLAGLSAAPTANGQSQELSILAGAAPPAATVTAPGVAISAGVTASVQVDYAYRLKETPAGSLYLELPAARVRKVSVGIRPNLVDAGTSQFFFTPGVRYVFAPAARVSPYVAGGFGFGWYDAANLTVRGPVSVNVTDGLQPAAGVGGGLLFRVSRGFGLRAEVRDYIHGGSTSAARNHLVFNAGFGFRF